ncbi:MAG: HNH endonuclease signature motif containing protein [Candidatus Komeilibacteria bacterium]|nr:HNH endonuclease signature motif containing protein [Candidatus Komeilibacteria bacterium]
MSDRRKYKDRPEYIKKAVSKRRKKLKRLVIEYKGGKCQLCGYSRCPNAFDLHHIDEKQKDFSLSKDGLTRSWERTKKEADKCILVCANCHRELHAGLVEAPLK